LVRPKLEAAGHIVVVPELTGLEDSRSLTEDVNLTTHVNDVVGTIRGLSGEVILVGHSYAGMIITAAAEHAPNAALVYADAFVPEDGQSVLDLMPQSIGQMFRAQAAQDGGWRLPAGDSQLDLWGLKPGASREFVRERLTDFTLRCFEEPVRLPSNAAASRHRVFIAAVGQDYPARPVFRLFSDRAKSGAWPYFELSTGHECHVEEADRFADILLLSSRWRTL
jgi:pimeloyl-ACP methyl ester carboxylesterase